VWRDVCRGIGAELAPAVRAIAGTPKAAHVVNARGAGGDETTFVDALAERIIGKHLDAFHKKGNRFSLLTEESGEHDYGAAFPRVIIDPIDGSINCKRGIPMFAVSIGVFLGPTLGSGLFGYIRNLANGDEIYAAAGSGKAYMNGKLLNLPPDRRRNVNVLFYEISKRKDIRDRCMPVILDAKKSRSLGSMTLAMAYTATGAADMYAHMKATRVLDYAAGKIILEQTGGLCADETGAPVDDLPLTLGKQGMLLAARSRALINSAVRTISGK
jgi:myo-inositol-1(or 4)-monophosphatase